MPEFDPDQVYGDAVTRAAFRLIVTAVALVSTAAVGGGLARLLLA